MTTKTVYLLSHKSNIIGKEIRTTFLGITIKRSRFYYPKAMKYQR